MEEKERYSSLDGIRAYAAAGIILMHVKANGHFAVSGFFYDRVVTSFTNFTYLFMLLSAFSLCCGYYERFKNNEISLETFYRRRYQRIWPFFALLCTVELIADHSMSSLYEWFADLTLAYGLLPNPNITVVGVGWFLGTIFVFYMIFPFFTFLIGNKKRAWLAFTIAVILNILCSVYFFDSEHVTASFTARENIVYSAVFFIMGGIIYLYRHEIQILIRKHIWVPVVLLALEIVAYFTINNSVFLNLILFATLTVLGISVEKCFFKGIFGNKVVLFIGSISMEMYLCHMFVFRVLEKLHITKLLNDDLGNYFIAVSGTLIGSGAFAFIMKKLISKVIKRASNDH